MRLPRRVPLHPLLIAAWFVLSLFAANVDEVAIADVLPVLAAAVGFAGLTLVASLVVLRITGRPDGLAAGILATAAVVVAFAYGHVAEALRPPGWLLQAVTAALLIGALVLALRIGRRVIALTNGLNAIGLLLVATTLATILPHELAAAARPTSAKPPVPVVGEPRPGPRRDVWYLVFDRYGAPRQLRAAWGIETTLDEWLTERGFYVAADSHANYVNTQLSLASSLNLDYLDELAARVGPESSDQQPIYDLIGDHALGRFLQSQGYTYIHVGSRFEPTNISRLADENPRPEQLSDFAAAFFDTTIARRLAWRTGLIRAQPRRERFRDGTLWQFATLEGLVERPGPKFVFAHFLVPHPPYVFAADGSPVDEEHPPEKQVAAYAEQLKYTDTRIKQLVERLLGLPPERRPIVILQADEGPYPERYNLAAATFDWSVATPEELRLKFGILNALYLPDIEPESFLYPTITPVNSVRGVLREAFGADLPPLPDRSYTSRSRARPYDFTDVTERIAGG